MYRSNAMASCPSKSVNKASVSSVVSMPRGCSARAAEGGNRGG